VQVEDEQLVRQRASHHKPVVRRDHQAPKLRGRFVLLVLRFLATGHRPKCPARLHLRLVLGSTRRLDRPECVDLVVPGVAHDDARSVVRVDPVPRSIPVPRRRRPVRRPEGRLGGLSRKSLDERSKCHAPVLGVVDNIHVGIVGRRGLDPEPVTPVRAAEHQLKPGIVYVAHGQRGVTSDES
jgi:hypothetical protein